MKASGYERKHRDWYVEPEWAIDALCYKEIFPGLNYDPACGQGNIVNGLIRNGFKAIGSDIDQIYEPDGDIFLESRDFFKVEEVNAFNIVSNPPYKAATPFIKRALRITSGKVAMLLRLAYLESQERADFFRSSPLKAVYIFSNRLSMPPGDLLRKGKIKAEGGSIPYAWFVWEKDMKGNRCWIGSLKMKLEKADGMVRTTKTRP